MTQRREVKEEEPTKINQSVVPENEQKPISEVLDFAMREIVKQDSLTDELICPMLRTVLVFLSRECNSYIGGNTFDWKPRS